MNKGLLDGRQPPYNKLNGLKQVTCITANFLSTATTTTTKKKKNRKKTSPNCGLGMKFDLVGLTPTKKINWKGGGGFAKGIPSQDS